MKLLALVAFNLKGAESDDYESIRKMLEDHGLAESLTIGNETVDLPGTTYLGVVEGSSAGSLKDRIALDIKNLLQSNTIKAKYLVSVSSSWSMAAGSGRRN